MTATMPPAPKVRNTSDPACWSFTAALRAAMPAARPSSAPASARRNRAALPARARGRAPPRGPRPAAPTPPGPPPVPRFGARDPLLQLGQPLGAHLPGREAPPLDPPEREVPADGQEHQRGGRSHRTPDNPVLQVVRRGDPEQHDAGDGEVNAEIEPVQAEHRFHAHGAPRSDGWMSDRIRSVLHGPGGPGLCAAPAGARRTRRVPPARAPAGGAAPPPQSARAADPPPPESPAPRPSPRASAPTPGRWDPGP